MNENLKKVEDVLREIGIECRNVTDTDKFIPAIEILDELAANWASLKYGEKKAVADALLGDETPFWRTSTVTMDGCLTTEKDTSWVDFCTQLAGYPDSVIR